MLERAAKLNDKLGGGSLPLLPIIETQAGDISAYIPTNVISITDGQIYLESDLFYCGIRPAINVGISVSRVGGNAQIKAMKQVAGSMRLDLAQYRELAAFAQFGSDLDKATQSAVRTRSASDGSPQTRTIPPLPVEEQVIVIFAGTSGLIDDVAVNDVQRFQKDLVEYMHARYGTLLGQIAQKKQITDDARAELKRAIGEFKEQFQASSAAARA